MRHSARLIAVPLAAGLLSAVPLTSADARTTTAAAPRAARPVAAQAGAPSGIAAKGAYLYDATRGRGLWGRATTTRRPVGSIAKVMTALVVIRAGHLDRKVTIKKRYADYVRGNDYSSAGLKAGDRVTAGQLLNAMLLPSGCDAAYALADVYGPGPTRFIAKMNRTARSLGLTGTYFRTFDGLPTSSRKEGYSTPSSVVRLARYAMKSATFRAIVARKTYRLPRTSGHHAYTWTNTNLLLGSYSGTIGIKTGHTNAAGYCLLFAARRGGRTLIGVVLNSTTTDPDRRFRDAARMLGWGFGTRTAGVRLRSLPPGMATD